MDTPPIHNLPYGLALFTAYDLAKADSDGLKNFADISVVLTGFSEAELKSTGLLETYYEEIGLTVGASIRELFVDAVKGDPGAALSDARWKPLAQNLLRLWYVGNWKAMPYGWAAANFTPDEAKGYNEFGRDVDRVISPQSYQEGLAWRAVGVNPQGAKQPGFASWTKLP